MADAEKQATGGSPGGGLIERFLSGGQELATPDVTKAQALAVAQAAIAVLVVLGFDLDEDVKNAIVTLSIALAAALPVSDAVLRQARARNARGITEARLLSRRLRDAGRTSPVRRAGVPPERRARIDELRRRLEGMGGEEKVSRPAKPHRTALQRFKAWMRRLLGRSGP